MYRKPGLLRPGHGDGAGAGAGAERFCTPGAAARWAQEFFGITIQPEKELLMILVKAEIKGGVMQAILKHAGPATPAHGICFSVRWTIPSGLRSREF